MRKRILSLFLALALFCGLLPQLGLTAHAATYSDTCGAEGDAVYSDYDGEYAWFPAPVMNLSQLAYENYSHGEQNAIDILPGGTVFAPFTGKIAYKDANWGYVTLQSLGKVHWADGTYDFMTVGFMHDRDISDLYVGQIIEQGTPFYHAGGQGQLDDGSFSPYAYGDHVHITVHKGTVTRGYPYGTGDVFAYNGLYINKERTTSIINMGVAQKPVLNGAPTNYSGLWKYYVAGPHTHDHGTYVYVWDAHPHYKCYRCSICGTIWEDRNEPTYNDTCETCLQQANSRGDKITFDTKGGHFSATVCTEEINRFNVGRGTGQLVVFTGGGTTVGTNTYGYEVAVNKGGKVIAKRNYGDSNTLTVPTGGFVLSGHGSSTEQKGGFVSRIKIGDYVAYDISNMTAYHYTNYEEYLANHKRGNEGEGYGVLPIPVKNGFYFNGWLTASGEYAEHNTPYSSQTLTASWATDDTAPASRLEYGGHVYELYEYPLTWTEAKAFCEAREAHLVTITTAAEQQAVEELISNGRKIIYFTGCSDEAEEGNWVWVTGEPFSSYTNWDPQLPEPDTGEGFDYGGIVHLAIGERKQFGEWLSNFNSPDDLQFSLGYRLCNYGFICEYDKPSSALHGYCGAEGDGSNLAWNLNTETGLLTITGSGAMMDLSGTDAWRSYSEIIRSVSLPNGLTRIGDGAFGHCSALISVTIPDSVMSIGWQAFYNCSALKSVVIPDGVTEIGPWTFDYCSALTSVSIPASVTRIGMRAFHSCISLTSVTIPDGVRTLGDGAFESCTALASVTIPDSVKGLGSGTFESCTALTSVTIPDSVTIIGDSAFEECIALTSITIPESVTEIYSKAFYGCSSLKSIFIKNPACSIGWEGSTEDLGIPGFTHVCAAEGSTAQSYAQQNNYPFGHNYLSKATAPNCTSQGYTTHTCSYCGDNYKDTYTAALGHNYSYSVSQAPTTTATGSLKGNCSRCSGTTTVTLPVLNTTDYNYTVVSNPSCTVSGTGRYTWKTTTYGIYSFDVILPQTAHNYVDTVTAPSCTSQGYTTHTCSNCGDNYKDTYTAALGHNYSYSVSQAPTTTANGSLKGNCSRCSGTTTVTLPVLNTTDYNYTVVSTPSCTVSGTGRYTWKTTTYGTYSFDVILPQTAHNYVDTVTAPNCTSQGYTTHTCTNCSSSYVDSYVSALGHDWGDWGESTAPTCTEKGEETRNCSRCEAKETRETAALGHDWGKASYKWSEDDGSVTATRSCKRNKKHKETETVNTTYQVTREATIEAEGEGVYTATFSNKAFKTQTKTVAIPKLPISNPFVDVKESDFFFNPVMWAIEKNVTSGTDATHFSPYATVKRSEAMLFFYAAKGRPAFKTTTSPFKDVKKKHWFYDAVLWAVENKITSGTDATHFSPNKTCIRSEILQFLYAAMDKPKYTIENPYSDVKKKHWYYDGAIWAYEKGLEKGENGKFKAKTPCTRAYVVTYLYRFITGKELVK